MPTVNGQTALTGCYLESARGQYAADATAEVAESFGLTVTRRDDPRRYRRIAEYCDGRGWAATDALVAEGWHSLAGRAWDWHTEGSDWIVDTLLNGATVGGYWSWEDGELFLSDEDEGEWTADEDGLYLASWPAPDADSAPSFDAVERAGADGTGRGLIY